MHAGLYAHGVPISIHLFVLPAPRIVRIAESVERVYFDVDDFTLCCQAQCNIYHVFLEESVVSTRLRGLDVSILALKGYVKIVVVPE